MSKKTGSKRKLQQDIEFLQNVIENNGKAMSDGAKKKKWTRHDIKTNVKPITTKQEEMFQSYYQGSQLAVYGSAGTGKTFLALYLAIMDVLERRDQRDRVVIIRSAVPTRDQGFLPGTLEEKQMHYENPYRDIMAELFHRYSTYDDMKEIGMIEFMTTSFVRGLTWDNCIVIIDEFQNMNMSELDSVLTRVGNNTRLIACGDIAHQCDLRRETTAAKQFIHIAEQIKEFALVEFTRDDIVRSEFVRNWIIARENLNI